LSEDCGENELEDITDYEAVMGSLNYVTLATCPDISYAVTALSRYNLWPFTGHMTVRGSLLIAVMVHMGIA